MTDFWFLDLEDNYDWKDGRVLLEIAHQLKRIADELEERSEGAK